MQRIQCQHLIRNGSLLPAVIQVSYTVFQLPGPLDWAAPTQYVQTDIPHTQSCLGSAVSVESKCVIHELHVEALQGYESLFCWLSSAPLPKCTTSDPKSAPVACPCLVLFLLTCQTTVSLSKGLIKIFRSNIIKTDIKHIEKCCIQIVSRQKVKTWLHFFF